MKTLQITVNELATLLESAIGSQIVRIETTTECGIFNKGRDTKKNPSGSMITKMGHAHTDIKKNTIIRVGTGWDYAKKMTKIGLADGSLKEGEKFIPQKASGMSPIAGSKFIYQSDTNESKYYLRYYLMEGIKQDAVYTLDGKKFDLSNVEYDSWRKPKKDKGFVRVVKLENMHRLRINKQEYRVIH